MWSFASSVTTSVISWDASCLRTPTSSSSTIWRISVRLSGWNTTVASIRLRNSGRKKRFISSWTRSFMRSYAAMASGSSPVAVVARNPSAASLFSISISSSRMTQYDFRRTVSVSWPCGRPIQRGGTLLSIATAFGRNPSPANFRHANASLLRSGSTPLGQGTFEKPDSAGGHPPTFVSGGPLSTTTSVPSSVWIPHTYPSAFISAQLVSGEAATTPKPDGQLPSNDAADDTWASAIEATPTRPTIVIADQRI